MGLIKGPLTFSRFRISGNLPKPFPSFLDQQIKAFAFREISLGTEEKSAGWTSVENVLDTDFAQAHYANGDYLTFSLRIDRKTIPPSLMKIKVLEAEKNFLTAKKSRQSKQAREEIRDRVRGELLNEVHPVPSFFDICWSVSQNWLLFGSLTAKALEEFGELFRKSFQVSLLPWLPWDPSHLDPSLAQKVASLKDGIFLEPGDQGEAQSNGQFLGREFLTWLWYKSEERGGAISVPGIGDVEVAFVRRLVLESGEGQYSQSVVCQGLHADLIEGKAAIRQGKRIKEARIQLTRETEKWEFTLKADRFSFQSVRLPETAKTEQESDLPGLILERIYLTDALLNAIDRLFSFFLTKRVSPKWSAEEIPHIKKWAQR